jgi:hypothetical protein
MEFTVTVTVAVLLHPDVVPVTVYVVVVVGETFTGFEDPNPSLQVYEVPPDAVKELVPPLQILVGKAEAVIVGIGFTFTVTVAVLLHPDVVPVTV